MNEMKELVDKLNCYRNAYYNDNQSLVSDKEYDLLFDRLAEMEKTTGIIYANSPTQNVGYEVVSKLKKVIHNHPLLSLDKTTDIGKFANYFGDRDAVIMAKMDGLTCSITYNNGHLVLAESRGNGEEGEDITHNVLTFSNIPKTIPYLDEIIIDGECIIDRKTFEEINTPLVEKATEEALKLGYDEDKLKEYVRKHSYANPRNLAAGSVRQLDSKIAAQRNIRFVAWKVYSVKDANGNPTKIPDYFHTAFEFAKYLGFEVVPHQFVGSSYDNFTDSTSSDRISEYSLITDGIREYCESIDYPIDGCTAAFDDVKYGESLGYTGHHPKHSMAFKFYQDDNETRLLDIEWSTSRTGLVNPVAILEPVEIDGTTVSRASLSNVSIIKELELGIGDIVTLIKANQIIPQITGNITRSNTYELPAKCPNCGHDVVINSSTGREMMYCTNPNCVAKIHDKISNFASREGLNIVGISDERLRVLMKHGYITDFASIYSLHKYKDEIAKIDGFGKYSVAKLIDAIEASKECKFSNLLVGLGIPGIGKSTAKTLAKYCIYDDTTVGEFDNLLEKFIAFVDIDFSWARIDGFGDVVSQNINQYVRDNKDEIMALIPIIRITDNKCKMGANLFGGKTFCITGKLTVYENRDSLERDIEKYGGKIVSSVTSKTDYLITNDTESGSSKNEKARKFGTKIITEKDFISMCGL